MTELRELIALRMFSDADAIAVQHGDNPIRWEDYQHQDWYYRRADSALGAIDASGRVTVDRARFERLLKPMQLYVQAEGIVVDFTGKGAIAFGKAFEDAVNEIRANPGDLEPLP